jgi:hypothetical protein
MIRNVVIVLGALALSLAPSAAPVRAADDEDGVKPFLGEWHTVADGIGEGWKISKDKKTGKLSAVGEFRDVKTLALLGGFRGKDVEYKDGKLTFIQVYVKKPRPNWEDGVKMTLEEDGEKQLKFKWETPSGKSGTRILVPFDRSKDKKK